MPAKCEDGNQQNLLLITTCGLKQCLFIKETPIVRPMLMLAQSSTQSPLLNLSGCLETIRKRTYIYHKAEYVKAHLSHLKISYLKKTFCTFLFFIQNFSLSVLSLQEISALVLSFRLSPKYRLYCTFIALLNIAIEIHSFKYN